MNISFKSPKVIKSYLVVGFIVILLIAGTTAYNKMNKQNGNNNNNNGEETTNNKDEKGENKVLATINDKEITQAMLDKQISQLVAAGQLPPMFESTQEEDAINQSVLEQMIADELMYNAALDQGINISENDVQKKFNEVEKQFEAGEENKTIEQALEEEGTSVSKFRESLQRQLVIEAYLSQLKKEYDINVTEDEIREFYDKQVKPQNEEISFEDVQDQIKNQLEQEQLAEFLPDILEELKEEANVQSSL